MILIRLPDGRITAVEEADVAGAVEAGAEVVDKAVKTKFGRESTASAVGPDLGGYIDPVEEQAAAIQAERRRSYEDEGLTAFGQGAVRSLTAGLIPFDSEESRLREEVNPYATVAGEVGGLVGGAILGAGAPGLAAKAGAAAAGGIKSTVGRFAAEAAVDGLTYATMREGIGAVVHDKPFSVEAIAAETLLSGGVGAALGVGVKGAGALRKALTKEEVAKAAIRSEGLLGSIEKPQPSISDIAEGVAPQRLLPEDSVMVGGRIVSADEIGLGRSSFKMSEAPGIAESGQSFKRMWDETQSLYDEVLAAPETSPVSIKAQPILAKMQRERAFIARKLKVSREKDALVHSQRDIKSYGIADDTLPKALDRMKPAELAEISDAIDSMHRSAIELDDMWQSVRQNGDMWFHADESIDLAGGSARLTGKSSRATRQQMVREAQESYMARMGDAIAPEADETISDILARDTGTATSKMATNSNAGVIRKWAAESPENIVRLRKILADQGIVPGESLEALIDSTQGFRVAGRSSRKVSDVSTLPSGTESRVKAASQTGGGTTNTVGDTAKYTSAEGDISVIPEFKRVTEMADVVSVNKRGGKNHPDAPKAWDKKNARPREQVIRAIESGEPPHIEELLMMDIADRRLILKGLEQKHIDSLAAEIRNNQKILKYEPNKTSPLDADIAARMDFMRRDLQKATRVAETKIPSVRAVKKPVAGLDAVAPAGKKNWISDTIDRAGMLGLVMAGTFPKLVAAKAVIQKYGARLAGAAERAMSNRAVQMVSRKAPVIAWAKIMAPDGDDRDRNLRAVQAISQSPEAWGAAVDEALANINPDSPTQRIEARERIQAQLGYLVQNAPSSLSPLRPVWSPSSIAHFNRLIDAWQDPLGVLANVKTAPSEQLNAVREMWPESYSEFMARLVDQVSTYAAEGKTIPRDIGRLLPMASASWSVSGMQTLQSMQTQPVEMDQSGKFNAQTAAPTTVSESLSSNRINLNK